ncbi:hypothetical protein NSK_007830 [Nannochloropsis salina CCMP1776]|jgi:FtsZ-interacting cell division protein YlmF|uniref:Uncharacterized protein n=1 Tax=Nannochloropsis salina CCMP1776 TaxID=1027361 RepID=A0A4D9CNX1_9STRA|nr:hypothetical protein NSK_007830 [Nannochloropsis salina CCMP1776]|eukprot:TFJ80830.1 hypothetical protein NSK_007830 [Nannochloropsis salina CCMP1776]
MFRLFYVASITLCLATRGLAQLQQEQNPRQQNVTTTLGPSNQQQEQQGEQNTTTGVPTQQEEEERPSAMSQLEVLLLGNHSWFDSNQTYHYFQNDYQIVNHSPHEICNVTLSAPLEKAEEFQVASSYNVKVTNSTQKRGIDLMAPMGDTHSIPANGILNIGYVLKQIVEGGQGAMSNMTPMSGNSTSATPTIEHAEYCDDTRQEQQQQHQQHQHTGRTNTTTRSSEHPTSGVTGGMQQNSSTSGGNVHTSQNNRKKFVLRHV